MIITVITPNGEILKNEASFAVVKNYDGETGILNNHLPTVIDVNSGFVRFDYNNEKTYVYLEQGLVEFSENNLNVIAIEATIGKSLEEAQNAYKILMEKRVSQSKKAIVDYSKQERELRENIALSKAGSV